MSADERVLRRSAVRIGIQTVAAVALTVLALTVMAGVVLLNSQHSAEIDQVDAVIARADDVGDPPAGMWLVIQQDGALTASPDLPSGFPERDELRLTMVEQSGRSVDVHVADVEYRVTTRPHGTGVIQVVADLSAEHAIRTRLVEALLLVGAFGLVLAGLTGVWLARRAVAPLAGALALQRRFVADAGHELRTPLTLLSTRAQLIQRSLRRHPQTPVDSDVDGLVADSRRLAAIVDDLLLSADGTVPRESVDLGALARAAADSIQPQAEQRHVRVVIAGETPATVLGASVRLRRAVDALLDNAVRHARSEVRLTVGRLGGHAVVAVSDDGPGIDPEIRPRLFDRFATTPADRGQGGNRRYGLGLALVSEIAAQHSGSVEVVAGQETTFRLRLPAV